MILSAPIYRLKANAKRLARTLSIPLHDALDRTAVAEGYASWSLLAARYAAITPAAKLYAMLQPGDMVLIAARPGKGKTLMALDLAAAANQNGYRSMLFTLEFTPADIALRVPTVLAAPGSLFGFDCSDEICADYIIEKMQQAAPNTLIIVDYLQLLDQRREHPPLAAQVTSLKRFAADRGLIMVFVSQISRTYDHVANPYPGLNDIRLPNPLDLGLFSKTCFMSEAGVQLATAV